MRTPKVPSVKVAIIGPGNIGTDPFMPFQPIPDRDSIAIGYAGVYSTFLLHAKRLGKQYGVDPVDILVELGRRKAVAGQEDWILDVTLELARKKKAG
jgi:4-hydroxy 2-oxovalerate aldolase